LHKIKEEQEKKAAEEARLKAEQEKVRTLCGLTPFDFTQDSIFLCILAYAATKRRAREKSS
jgi:hypothetical protein